MSFYFFNFIILPGYPPGVPGPEGPALPGLPGNQEKIEVHF